MIIFLAVADPLLSLQVLGYFYFSISQIKESKVTIHTYHSLTVE